VVAGSTALFELKIVGKPFPEVCWFHNNVQLSQGGRVQMTSSEGPQGGEILLRISPVLDTDAGSYACILNSPAGQSRTNTCQMRVQPRDHCPDLNGYLMTRSPPQIVVACKDLELTEGAAALFTAVFEGNPGVTVHWEFNGLLIKEDSEGLLMTFDGRQAQLSIPETMVEDEGTYSCYATNALGQVVTSARLFINEHAQE